MDQLRKTDFMVSLFLTRIVMAVCSNMKINLGLILVMVLAVLFCDGMSLQRHKSNVARRAVHKGAGIEVSQRDVSSAAVQKDVKIPCVRIPKRKCRLINMGGGKKRQWYCIRYMQLYCF